MPEDNNANRMGALAGVVIIARVAIFLVIWLGLFLALFLGYFTVPIIVVGVITLLYALTDIGFYMAVNRRKRSQNSEGNHTENH